ncbi:MAG TPA: hypothetical protein DDZ68_07440 [Parvularcula sp.]|nr:hypothetical protein [Parvularcula sp.]HBS33349.1 hypothetical protein [Parvularcula sp.]HBS35530.1 hypothetical protein [Parvularcula sp.]
MRTIFALSGGLSILGAIMDAALLALSGLWVMASIPAPDARVGGVLESLSGASPGLQGAIGRDPFPALAFALPALLYFLVRIILGLSTGASALMAAWTERRR